MSPSRAFSGSVEGTYAGLYGGASLDQLQLRGGALSEVARESKCAERLSNSGERKTKSNGRKSKFFATKSKSISFRETSLFKGLRRLVRDSSHLGPTPRPFAARRAVCRRVWVEPSSTRRPFRISLTIRRTRSAL